MNDDYGYDLGPIKSGISYKGIFYEFGSSEYKTLMLVEGRKEENKDTLLGIIASLETENTDNITHNN